MEKFLEKGNDTIFRNHGNDTEDILHLYYASLSLTVSNESLFDGDLKPKKTVYLNYIKTMLLRFAQNRNSSSCNKYTCRTSGEYFNEYCQLTPNVPHPWLKCWCFMKSKQSNCFSSQCWNLLQTVRIQPEQNIHAENAPMRSSQIPRLQERWKYIK